MSEPVQHQQLSRDKVNLETSRVPWTELQRFFAGGLTIEVSTKLDLVDVACQLADDNKTQVERWMLAKKINKVSDEQAKKWYENNTIVWAVVVKPWVLVQDEIAGN